MIIFVTTYAHRYTHKRVANAVPAFRQMAYPMLFARRSLPRATYIFSDFDRLGFWQLELAAHIYRQLKAAGLRVLNDPARALQRLALLRRLHRAGINRFTAWPATDAAEVDRFPVFLRTASAHRGNLTELLADRAALDDALGQLVQTGYPLADLVIVQYRAQAIHEDIFRKLAAYRIGDEIIPAPSVHQRHWAAKYGENGIAGAAAYEEDLERIRTNPYGAVLRHAFDAASIDYGRVDFGIVDGRPEIYEINTNPTIGSMMTEHPFAARIDADRISRAAYDHALASLDDPHDKGRVAIAYPDILLAQRRRFRLLPGFSWVP